MENIINITDESFEKAVLKSGKPVLVDFWASWCMPCRMQGETIEKVAPTYGDKILVAKLNVDENEKTAMDFRITSIPTLMIFKDGEMKEKLVGFTDGDELCELINKYL